MIGVDEAAKTPQGRRLLGLRLAVGILCFGSGMAGLTYEVVWYRLLAVVLGNASFATAAVLAAVMGGMGLGALWVGPRADRGNALRLYGVLEMGLGAVVLLVPTLVDVGSDLSLPLLRLVDPGWGSFAIRFAIAGGVLLLPAFLLGATLPALARTAEQLAPPGPDRVGRGVGAIYALNTAGAALGCVLTGYFLLGAWGVTATSQAAAIADLVVGALALLLSVTVGRRLFSSGSQQHTSRPEEQTGGADGAEPMSLPAATVLGLAFVSGFVVLGLQTVWTRFFLIVFGHDVHAFSAMLAAVLTGLAVGSFAYRVAPARLRACPLSVPGLFTLLGVLALGALALIGHRYLSGGLDVLGLEPHISITRSEERGLLLQAVFALLCVVPATMAAGAIFPALVSRHPSEGRRGESLAAGQRAGRVLAANTAGTLLGPLVTPLMLIPTVGVQGAAVTLGSLAGAAGLWLLLAPRAAQKEPTTPEDGKRRARLAGACLAAASVALCVLALPADLPRRVLARKIGDAHLDFELYREGRSATVAVVRNDLNDERQLFVNGINEVTTRLVHDQSFELLGHLGMLLHRDPKRVAVICLGGGLAGGAVTRHDVSELVVVDLEPAVVAAAERFSDLNHGLLDDPRLELIIDDGRAHLRTEQRPYDVVVLDSTHPRAVDSWILYTREFYQTARASLSDDGILVQWLPLHGLSVDEFRILVGTFLETFPEATLWTNVGFETYGQTAYSLLVGPKGDSAIDADRVARRVALPRVRDALTPFGLHTAGEVLECLHAGPQTLRTWSEGLPINTDDHPLTQFVTAHTRSTPMTPARLLEAFEPPKELFQPPLPDALAAELEQRWEAQALFLTGRLEQGAIACGSECRKPAMFQAEMARGPAYYQALAERYPHDGDRMLEIAAGLSQHGRIEQALTVLDRADSQLPDDPRPPLHRGLLKVRVGDVQGAIEAYRRALARDPDRILARVGLGLALAESGAVDAAVFELERAVESDPELAEAHAALGSVSMQVPRGRARAEQALRRALELDPRLLRAHTSLGRLLLGDGRVEEAHTTLDEGLAYGPLDVDLLFNRAVAERRSGRMEEARETLLLLLRVQPGDEDAIEALAALGPLIRTP